MLQVLATMNPHPESVPVNALVAVKGTPLEDAAAGRSVGTRAHVRRRAYHDAAARVRLVGRTRRTYAAKRRRCAFMAGANSIFYGEKLLTTSNNDAAADRAMIEGLGLKIMEQQNEAAA